MIIIQCTNEEALYYQTGVEFILLGQYYLWGIRHDVKVGLIVFPGSKICFLQTID